MKDKKARGSSANGCLIFLDFACNIGIVMLSCPVPNFPHLVSCYYIPLGANFHTAAFSVTPRSWRRPTMRTPRIILRSIPIPFLQIVFRQAVNEVSSLQLKVEKKQTKRERRVRMKLATNCFQLPSHIMSIFLELRLCNANDIMPITLSDFTNSCRKSEQGLLIQKMDRLGVGFQDSPAFHFSPQC